MNNKCVLITGTTNGIGKDLKEIYLAKNYNVVSINKLGSKVGEIENNFNFNIDITIEKEVNNLFDKLLNEKLIPEIFIFNAGINKIDLDENFKFNNFHDVIETNFFSVTYFCNYINKKKLEKKTLVFISSFSTIYYNKKSLGYYFSKLLLNNYFYEIKKLYPNNHYKLISLGPIRTKIKRFIENESNLNRYIFSFLSIKSIRAAKVIYNFSNSNKSIMNYPFKVYLFYRFCRLIDSMIGIK